MNETQLFICPKNDYEAEKTSEYLKNAGRTVIVTQQNWGASWDMLEAEVFEQLKSNGFELEDAKIEELKKIDQEISKVSSEKWQTQDEERKKELDKKIEELTSVRVAIANELLNSVAREAEEKSIEIFGIELKGLPKGMHNIDHHCYKEVTYDTGVPLLDNNGEHKKDWKGNLLYTDDRSNSKSAIEQTVEIAGIELDGKDKIDMMFIAANDKAYIGGMKECGKQLGMSEEDIQAVVAYIRSQERRVRGITLEQEAQAEESIEKLGKTEEKKAYIKMTLPHSKTATVTDRLYGQYDNLLIITKTEGEFNFYGQADNIMQLLEQFGGWSTALDVLKAEGNGYWGKSDMDEEMQKRVEEFVDQLMAGKTKENDKGNRNIGGESIGE